MNDRDELITALDEHALWMILHHDECEDDTCEGCIDGPVPDPIAYGPRGYRCGCGKNAHSNLVPCTPDPSDVAAEKAAQRSVDAQFPIVAAFLREAGEPRG